MRHRFPPLKIFINKSVPNAGKTGVPSNLYIMVTEKAHFSNLNKNWFKNTKQNQIIGFIAKYWHKQGGSL
ncbi:MAG: hypothetical protein BWY03_00540 [Parcubacteria group bacterium ADurb.Bin159]|nr:MAG: hypothetical protein BWY03_00540 [Parcubacteria group bacterium ADurb.Bin159]